jgi:hypothetical protein
MAFAYSRFRFKHALQLLLVFASLWMSASAEEAVTTEAVEETPIVERHPWPHEIASIVSLTDETFEHTTQASSGQTTGSWLIWFYNSTADNMDDVSFTDAFPELDVWNEHHIVVASVNVHGTGTQTKDRFYMGSKPLPAFLYIHHGKMFRYPSVSSHAWKELLAFCQNPSSTPEDIPPPPDFMRLIIAKLAANPQLMTGVMVMIMMLGAFLAAVSEHFVPPKKGARPVPPAPGDKTLKAE